MSRWKKRLLFFLLPPLLMAFILSIQAFHTQDTADLPAFRQWTHPARRAWFVQLGAFPQESDALSFSVPVQSLGQAGYVLPGTVYRCLGSVHFSPESAQVQADHLRAAGYSQACVYELCSPARTDSELCLERERIARLSAIQALWDASVSAQQTAALLDAGAILPASAQSALRSAMTCARIGNSRLSSSGLPDSLSARLRYCGVYWALEALQSLPEEADLPPASVD